MRLSMAQAQAVVQALIGTHGIAATPPLRFWLRPARPGGLQRQR